MEKIKARLHGGVNAPGRVVKFKIVDRVPAGAEPVKLDPEQRVGYPDDDNQWKYEFYLTDDGDYVAVERETEMEKRIYCVVYESTRYWYINVEARDMEEAEAIVNKAIADGKLTETDLPEKVIRVEAVDDVTNDVEFPDMTVNGLTKQPDDVPEYVDYKPLSQREWELYEQLRDRVLMKEIDEKIGFIAEEIELPTNDEEWPNMMRDVFIEYKEEDGGSNTDDMWDDRIDAIFSRVLEGYGYKRDWENDRWVKEEA